MKDGVIKGTGDSRYLKSNIDANTTFAEFLTALRAGTLPIDLNGINADGWEQIGSALNKANLLPDDVATTLGLDSATNPQIKDALLAVAPWRLLQAYTVAGAYTFTVPEGVTTIGVTVIAAGGAGGGARSNSPDYPESCAQGGASGNVKHFIMNVVSLETYTAVVGAGGIHSENLTTNGRAPSGGSSSFGGVVVIGGQGGYAKASNYSWSYVEVTEGGQGPLCVTRYPERFSEHPEAPFGGISDMTYDQNGNPKVQFVGKVDVPIFDFSLVFASAGGGMLATSTDSYCQTGGKVTHGSGGDATTNGGANATGYGNGGGGFAVNYNNRSSTHRAGNGSDGAVLIYER